MLFANSNFRQSLHSQANRWLWKLRSQIRFKRRGYEEFATRSPSSLDQKILNKYSVQNQNLLSDYALKKNAQTLSWLENILDKIDLSHVKDVVDAGCQDFIRLPALRAYLRNKHSQPEITGVEIDAYPILNNLHSRWDRAQYYISLENDGAKYFAEDFFKWHGNADLAFGFFPFVSSHPTLKWGLPLEFASATQWIQSFERVLRPRGYAVVVHHLAEEEKLFDEARQNSKSALQLLERKSLDNLLLVDAQAFISLYQLK